MTPCCVAWFRASPDGFPNLAMPGFPYPWRPLGANVGEVALHFELDRGSEFVRELV
jgi:hypothetical protein